MRRLPCRWSWAFVPLVVLVVGGIARGQSTYSWTAGTSNSWGGTTWTRTSTGGGTGIPGAADTANISVAGVSNGTAYTVSVIDARSVATGSLARNEATLAVNASGSLAVSGGFTFSGGTLTTTGSMTVGGTFAFNNNAAKLDNSGGGLVLNGAFNWDAGSVVGGTVTASHGGAITLAGIVDGSNSVLKFAGGSWTWSNGNIQVNNGGTFEIDSGATVSITPNNTSFATTGGGTVNNAGTLEKIAGTGSSTVPTNVTLNNSGTWRVTSGSWNIQGGVVNNTGVIDIGSAGTVSANGGTLNLNAGSSITGTGQLVMTNAGGHIAVNGAVNSAGGLALQRGVFDGAGSIAFAGSVDLQGFNSNCAVGTTVYANGGGDWTGTGTPFIGTGSVNINGGTVTWSGNAITFKASGGLSVGANGTLDLKSDTGISVDAGFSPTVIISGLFKKSAGTGNSGIDPDAVVTVNSGGVVDAQTGTINFQGTAYTNNGTVKGSTGTIYFNANANITVSGSGTLASDAGGALTFSPGTAHTFTQSGGAFTNAGTLNVNSGTVKVAAAVNLTNYDAGTHTLTGGVWKVANATLDLDGRTISTIAAGTTVELGSSGSSFAALANLTQITGFLRLTNGATLTPLATVNNGGTVDVSATFGGAMNVTSTGILTGFGTVNGTVTVQSGGLLSPGPGPYNASGTRVLTTGRLVLNGGSKYAWEINSWAANASAGNATNGFDQVKGLSGVKLDLSNASAGNTVVVKIASLNGSAAGQIGNFDNTVVRSWVIADFSNGNTTGGVLNFSAAEFTLDTSAFLNDLGGGSFSISTDAAANQLVLTFTPVPEPATVLLVGAAGLAAVALRRRRGVDRPTPVA